MQQPDLWFLSESIGAASCGRLWVSVFSGQVAAGHLERLAEENRRRLTRMESAVLTLSVIEASGARLEGAERQIAIAMTRALRDSIEATAVVVEAEGLRGALHRSIVAGVSLVARNPFPQKVFGVAADAARWIGGFEGGLDEATILATIAAARPRREA